MNATAYRSLQYGNVLQKADGSKWMVIRTNRQPNGDCKAIAVAPCLQEGDVADISVIATDRSETLLVGRTIEGE